MRATGLSLLGRLLTFEHLPVSHRYDLIAWFTSSLRQNKNQMAHYLDGLKGCGSYLKEQI
jgi:hypothetical protein